MIKPFPWQVSNWRRLLSAQQQGRLPHALLFNGQAGMGLEQFSFAFAARLLCSSTENTEHACGQCKSCLLLQAGNHPDLLSINPEEPGKQIKVEPVRDLVSFIQTTSQYGRHKIAIINPAEAMNRSAANGLLKTLEEPPAGSLLLLLSEKTAALPITIRSRCQKIDFQADRSPETLDWLQLRLGDGANPSEVLMLAGGAPLKAVEIFESEEQKEQLELLEDLKKLKLQPYDPIKLAEKWLAWDASRVFRHLLNFFAIMSRMRLGNETNNSPVHKHLQGILKGLDLEQLIRCYDILLRHYNAASGPISLNKQGLLEDFIIHWQNVARQARG